MLTIAFFSSILFLVRCSSGHYEHGYFDGMSETCRESSSCNGNTSTVFSISRSCQCDHHCATYGDCCRNSPYFKPSPLLTCVTAGDWNTAAVVRQNYYYMITSCPSDWTDEETRSRCENYMETIRRQPILGHPVTSNATNITYLNYHCARCNGDLHISTLIRWKLAVNCGENFPLPVPDTDTVIKESTYKDFRFKPKFANVSYHTCKLYVWRPWNLLRKCHEKTIATCPPLWRNDTVRAQCEDYTSLVFKLGVKPYRNPHCATCNNIREDKLECEKEDLEIETLGILFDYFDTSSDVVGQKRLCPSMNEAYDPIVKKCVNIYCSIAGPNGDYGSESCYGNISSYDIKNCSILTFESEEYMMNDTGTATLLNSNIVYVDGQFRIRDDGRLEVCVEFLPLVDKFSVSLKYITFLGLGISMGCLVLHLVAFVANPALQNVSDKSLASLCTALFLAYGAFIIGQLLEDGSTFCKVTAVITYFSFLSSFSWLVLMAFDVWHALRLSVTRLRVVSGQSRRYAFIVYSTLGWLVLPIIPLSAALATEYGQVDTTLRPRFGVHHCWFHNRKALFVFFVIPVGVIMVLNLYFFVSSACMICSATMSPSHTSRRTHRNHTLFSRLALLMGLTWIMGFIAGYFDMEEIWYIFIALNAFQGVFIFLAFTMNKVKKGYKSQVSYDTKSRVENSASCWSRPRKKTSRTETTDWWSSVKAKRPLLSCSGSAGHE